jgi:tetratricopeptide (TPR) repeat protein
VGLDWSRDRARLDEAAAIYTKLIGKYPGQPAAIEAHFEMGLVLSELGRKAESADYFQKYVSLNPTSPEAPIALEKAADLLLFRAPSRSAELYALAQLKAGTNQKPSTTEWSLSRWLPAKRRLADALARTWVLAVLGLVVLAAVLLLARVLVRRLRKTPVPAGA